mmetsp:Transcript_62053/g.108640  ORF Transcript_62053/g.108640 Transcript_62053/m.108640 type:complete len:234 (-) Transcript_62053:60-761(-)
MGIEDAGKMQNAPPPELHSEQDMLAWKREYNIRQREADWKRKQDELLTQKRVAWEIERCERENRLAAARETRRREELEARVYQQHTEIDRRYKERCRDVEIDRREKAWEEKENNRLITMHQDHIENTQTCESKRASEKERRCEEMRNAAAERAAKKQRDLELNAKREANIKAREAERQARAAEEAKQLKTDSVAKSKAIVSTFTERTVPVDTTLVSILTQAPIVGMTRGRENA